MPTVAIDACALLNLLATGCEADIVRAHGFTLVTTRMALAEVQYLVGPPDDDGNDTRIAADCSILVSAGQLSAVAVGQDLEPAFVGAASHFTDADASVVALAAANRLPLWTDDRRVYRFGPKLFPDLRVLSTLAILRDAFARLGTPPEHQREIARKLKVRGNFEPPKWDKFADWYRQLLAE